VATLEHTVTTSQRSRRSSSSSGSPGLLSHQPVSDASLALASASCVDEYVGCDPVYAVDWYAGTDGKVKWDGHRCSLGRVVVRQSVRRESGREGWRRRSSPPPFVVQPRRV
jgi:hypothetical protein